ncbi:MAG TPA: MFS transporter [Acidimicrobiales bacterium]|nr:MFS transporter [Acidimicrobiales bacterium]
MTDRPARAGGQLPLLGVPDERRLAPVTAAFILIGLFWGAWAVSAVDVERALGLNNGGFGLLMSAGLLGGAAGNAAGGSVTERWGTSRVLSVSLGCWGLLALGVASSRSHWLFGLVLLVFVGVNGVVDVAMNVAATASLSGAPGYLVRFHARFNAGAAVGAGLSGALIASHHGWRVLWLGIGTAGLALASVCARAPMPAAGSGQSTPLAGAIGVLRREGLVLVAAAFAVGAMVEGGIELWGVLYLRTQLHSGLLIGAGGSVLAYAVATAARVSLGPAAARQGAARGVLLGAGTAAAGAVLLATAPLAPVAAIGLVLGAGGISMYWPLLIAHAGAGRARPGSTVGAVTAFGYLGLMSGPGLVGLLSQGVGLRWALLVLAAGAAFVAVAPTFDRRTP